MRDVPNGARVVSGRAGAGWKFPTWNPVTHGRALFYAQRRGICDFPRPPEKEERREAIGFALDQALLAAFSSFDVIRRSRVVLRIFSLVR